MNKKMLIIILSLCLIIGISAAGTAMMLGGSDNIGCEVEFSTAQVTLYRAPNGEHYMPADTSAMPSPVTVKEEIELEDGSVWYCLEGEGWAELFADYTYISAAECTLIPKPEIEPTEEPVAEPAIEAVELEGDIVINSEDTQLAAETVTDEKLSEIESGLAIPQADASVTRETYCFDIHAEQADYGVQAASLADESETAEPTETTVTVSGIAQPGSTVNVYHMYDDTNYTKYEVIPCTVNDDGSVTFTTKSFSEFYFTVDFHNDAEGITWSIEGESSVLLSEVFAQLSINEDAYSAESVVFSDPSLISVERQADGDWLLTSLAAFDTEETLTITFADGHEYVMRVTDASVGQQTTDSEVEIGSSATLNSYQVLGTQYNNGICVTYSSAKMWHTHNGTFYMYNGNTGAFIASGTIEHVYAVGTSGTNFSLSSPDKKYWFHVYGCKNSKWENETNDNAVKVRDWNGGSEVYVRAYSTVIGTKSDNGYCNINQNSQASVSTAYRNVEIRAYSSTTQYTTIKTYNNVLFPSRDMKTSDIIVSNYNTDQFDTPTVEISGNTYIVKLNPKTYVVKAGIMTKNLGDNKTLANSISKVELTGGFYNSTVTTKSRGESGLASSRFLVNSNYTVTATYDTENYVFAGWYDGDSPSANLISTEPTYTATLANKDQVVTLYARVVEINPLYVDSYYRAGNGRYGLAYGIDGDPNSFRITFKGSELTKNYINGSWWYIVLDHGLIPNGTKQQAVTIDGTITGTDNNAMIVGTANPGDNFYDRLGRYNYSTYTLNGDNIGFWKAGVGLNLVSLDYVRYQADTQQWKYGYQWTYKTWTYNFKERSWVETPHTVSFPASYKEGIDIPADPGRINFLYKQEPETGPNSFYLRYYANCLDTSVRNIPPMQSVTNLKYDTYWFTVDGLSNIVDEDGQLAAQPTRAGHTFIGWSTNRKHSPLDTESNDIWTPEKFNKEITSNEDFNNRQIEVEANTLFNPERLFAIWQKNTNNLVVTYHVNWGSGDNDVYGNPITYNSNPYIFKLSDKPADPTREGYEFAGWYYGEDCVDGDEVDFGSLIGGGDTIYADTDIYARWVVKITGTTMESLGDKRGDNSLVGNSISKVEIIDTNVNEKDEKLIDKNTISGTYDAYEKFTLKATVNTGYRFIGWYDSNELDSQGRPTGKLVSTKAEFTGRAEKTATYYARAVEESLLAVDCYVRLSNGRFIYDSNWKETHKIYGVEVSKDYSSNHNWYIIAQYGLINDGTKPGTVDRKYKDDTHAMLVGTGNPNDKFYEGYTGFTSDAFKDKTQGHYDFSYYDYKEADGSITPVPFKKSGIGLDLVTLNNVYYDADMTSTGSKLSGQTWKYGYQWTTSYWTYTIKNGWQEHKIPWELEDIPIYEDEGRVNFVYQKDPGPGQNSFYIKYHANAKGLVSNIPASESMVNIDETSYWFGISGLYPKVTQPTRAGYTFVGWSTNPNHAPDVVDDTLWTYDKYKASINSGDLNNCQIKVTLPEGKNSGTVHLYAIWKSSTAKTEYEVAFDLNYLKDGENVTEPSESNKNNGYSNIWKTLTVNKGEICADPGTVPSRDGYTFGGWYYTRTCDDGTEFDRANTPIYNDTVVYAKWNPNYTVHYYVQGTTTKVADDKVVANNEVGTVVTETALSVENYMLVGDSTQSLTIGNDPKDNVIIFYYKSDSTSYRVEAYIMGTDGTYPTSPTKTESSRANVNSTVNASTDPAHWITDGSAKAFTFDSTNANNVTSATVAANDSTVLKVYFSRNQYTLTWTVTKDDDAAYKDTASTKYYYGQTVTEKDITAPEYYTFDNWAKGKVAWPGTMPAKDVNIAGELIRQRADLKISKSGMASGETAIFTVTGKGLGSGITVMIPNGESVTIKGLAVGESYTVTEQSGWSWKYQELAAKTVTLDDSGSNVSFSNIAKLIKWFTDEFYKDNRFGA